MTRPGSVCTRRTALAGLAACGIRLHAATASESGAAWLPVHRPADFIDSVGVNAHLGSEPYRSRKNQFQHLASALGIRHLRDELRPDIDLAQWRGLYEQCGIRSHLLVSPLTNSVPQMMRSIADLGVGRVSAVEGQNEGDSPWFKSRMAEMSAGRSTRLDWPAEVTTYQAALYRALRAEPATARMPVLSPTVLDYRPQDIARIAAAAAYCDMVAVHSYAQHGEEPETLQPYSSLHWYLDEVATRFKPGAPCMATETGYSTFIQPGSPGVSEDVAACYIPRLLLNNFSAGIVRTFLYEFMDEGHDPANSEQHYGLVTPDAQPKPAYRALQRLLGALAGPPASGDAARGLACRITSAPGSLRCLLFRRRDDFVLLLWRAIPSWDPAIARSLPVPPATVVLEFEPAFARIERLVLQEDGPWVPAARRSGAVLAAVDDRVTLLRLVS